MGGSQSSRKLTISNDDPANVIRVSDSVVQRFRGDKTDGKSEGNLHQVIICNVCCYSGKQSCASAATGGHGSAGPRGGPHATSGPRSSVPGLSARRARSNLSANPTGEGS